MHREREQPAGSQDPRGFRDGQVRVGERHRTVIAEDDVEARHPGTVSPRRSRARAESRHPLAHQRAGVLELAAQKLSSPVTFAPLSVQRDRPLRRAAAKLEDVAAADIAKDLQFGLGELPDAPCRAPGSLEL